YFFRSQRLSGSSTKMPIKMTRIPGPGTPGIDSTSPITISTMATAHRAIRLSSGIMRALAGPVARPAHDEGRPVASAATPELTGGQASALRQGRELEPHDARMNVVEPDPGGRESAIRPGDDVLAADDLREADDPLGDQLRVLDQVRGVADDPGNENHPLRRA